MCFCWKKTLIQVFPFSLSRHQPLQDAHLQYVPITITMLSYPPVKEAQYGDTKQRKTNCPGMFQLLEQLKPYAERPTQNQSPH